MECAERCVRREPENARARLTAGVNRIHITAISYRRKSCPPGRRDCSSTLKGGHVPKLSRTACILSFAITCMAAGAPGAITLNDREYFEAPGFAF